MFCLVTLSAFLSTLNFRIYSVLLMLYNSTVLCGVLWRSWKNVTWTTQVALSHS